MNLNKKIALVGILLIFGIFFCSDRHGLFANSIDSNPQIQVAFKNTLDPQKLVVTKKLNSTDLCKLYIFALNMAEYLQQKYSHQELQASSIWMQLSERIKTYNKLGISCYKTAPDYWKTVLYTLIDIRKYKTYDLSVLSVITVLNQLPQKFPLDHVFHFLDEAINCCWAPGIQVAADYLKKHNVDVSIFLNTLDSNGNTKLEHFILDHINTLILPENSIREPRNTIKACYTTLLRWGATLNTVDESLLPTWLNH